MVNLAEFTTGPIAPGAPAVSSGPQSVSLAANTTTQTGGDSGRYRLIQSFSRHDTIKLDESNFIQW